MDHALPDHDVDLPEVSQLGFVVSDLDDAMDRYGLTLGVREWEVYRFEPPHLADRVYRGDPGEFTMEIGNATAGDTRVELIEPREGESIYTEFLDAGREGLHHVACFDFEDPAAAAAAYEEAGLEVTMRGAYRGGSFWYFETEPYLDGLAFEIVDPVTGGGDVAPDDTYRGG
jgi:hypothetical protein